MGLKKYEIITVGSDKRVRALRSWAVGGRYVNIGDVGGIVYDEKTLSQDGACWLFRGNFGFPGARIGGDSIVDVGEFTNAIPKPNVTIDGASQVVGTSLVFNTDVAASPTTLIAADFEQGSYNYVPGIKWENMMTGSPNYIRTKTPIFAGGVSTVLNCGVAGYLLSWYALDRDGVTITASATVTTGEGVTTTIVPCQYFLIRLTKNPADATVPEDVTAATLTITKPLESAINIRDSRLELNDTGTVSQPHVVNPSGNMTGGVTDIVASTIVLNKAGSVARASYIVSKIYGSKVTGDLSSTVLSFVGTYNNVKNITASGSMVYRAIPQAYSIIQATDCNDFKYDPAVIIPSGFTLAAANNMPFIFQGCNVPNGIFYHHAQIANTYKNIDFAKAQADLGKQTTTAGVFMVSSEIEGMYRLYSPVGTGFGCLVEANESVRSLTVVSASSSYGTVIYKDAYIRGRINFAGTNVFGHKVRSHPLAQTLNVQPRAVRGSFDATTVGGTITNVVSSTSRVCLPNPFRVNGATGLKVDNIPAGVEATFIYVNMGNVVTANSPWTANTLHAAEYQLSQVRAYILFRKADNTSGITPEDLAGVTVTVYNGCKIVNTGSTEINMKGNIRVEDNATLVNASVTGSGYFGGNSVVYYNPAVWASLDFNGTVFMKDDAVFAPTELTGANALVRMEGKAKFTGSVDVASTNLSFIMRDNAVIEGKANTRSGVVMSGNSKVTATGQITAASRGVLVMEENASIEANTTVIGAITLAGNYKGNVVKTWTGKRTITDVNAPEYDNNAKTQYDF